MHSLFFCFLPCAGKRYCTYVHACGYTHFFFFGELQPLMQTSCYDQFPCSSGLPTLGLASSKENPTAMMDFRTIRRFQLAPDLCRSSSCRDRIHARWRLASHSLSHATSEVSFARQERMKLKTSFIFSSPSKRRRLLFSRFSALPPLMGST